MPTIQTSALVGDLWQIEQQQSVFSQCANRITTRCKNPALKRVAEAKAEAKANRVARKAFIASGEEDEF